MIDDMEGAGGLGNMEPDTESQVWINGINDENKVALVTWVKETKTNLVQINGQRIYGGPPPGWVGHAPGSGSEVFIGKIPQDIYEDKLIPLFQRVGKLYEFRLMMTFSGLNRGFAYARYVSKRYAFSAISALNGFEIKSGCRIFVCRSTEKCEITLDGLPCLLDKVKLLSALREMTFGVEEVLLHPSLTRKDETMAIVKYNSHRAAALAKKSLSEGSQLLGGHSLTVDWLKSDIKQKLESPRPTQFMVGSPLYELWNPESSATSSLNRLCQKWRLGQPQFLIKFLSMSSCGWQRFWYRVVIPNYSTPFTGYAWLIGENLIPTEKHEKAKEVVALNILAKLDAGMTSCFAPVGLFGREGEPWPKMHCWVN